MSQCHNVTMSQMFYLEKKVISPLAYIIRILYLCIVVINTCHSWNVSTHQCRVALVRAAYVGAN